MSGETSTRKVPRKILFPPSPLVGEGVTPKA